MILIIMKYMHKENINNIGEAKAQINYVGNRYSSSIFTTSTDNASKLIKEVKSKIITVNTSPTIERIIDIKQTDLINVIYPMNFTFEGSAKNIDLY